MLERNLVHSNRQHAAIVRAILAGDPDGARQAMEEHVEGTAALLRGFLGSAADSTADSTADSAAGSAGDRVADGADAADRDHSDLDTARP
jgi:hypothetical protein